MGYGICELETPRSGLRVCDYVGWSVDLLQERSVTVIIVEGLKSLICQRRDLGGIECIEDGVTCDACTIESVIYACVIR